MQVLSKTTFPPAPTHVDEEAALVLEAHLSDSLSPDLHTPSLSVVIPTRNEADNICPLLIRTKKALSDLHAEVIFVDDSTDVTPTVIEGAKKQTFRHQLDRAPRRSP